MTIDFSRLLSSGPDSEALNEAKEIQYKIDSQFNKAKKALDVCQIHDSELNDLENRFIRSCASSLYVYHKQLTDKQTMWLYSLAARFDENYVVEPESDNAPSSTL